MCELRVWPGSSSLSVLVLLLMTCFLIQPATTQRTYSNFTVCYINTTPKEDSQGTMLTVIFGVFYSDYSPCGDPCQLESRQGQNAPTGSFTVIGSPAVNYKDITVVPTGKPGEYRAELRLPTDILVDKKIVFIVIDSLYDGKTTGPGKDTSHVETPDPIDNSEFTVRSANPIVALFDFVPGGFLTILTLLAFAALLIVLFFFRRSKRRP